jgi:hypothetical protein
LFYLLKEREKKYFKLYYHQVFHRNFYDWKNVLIVDSNSLNYKRLHELVVPHQPLSSDQDDLLSKKKLKNIKNYEKKILFIPIFVVVFQMYFEHYVVDW